MNFYAIKAIYTFEMARTLRTLLQSIASPVLSTTLYFIVFGAAIGSRMGEIDGINYGAFIIPGLIMLSLLNESISNASFGIYMPKFTGTIYEILSAPISYIEILIGYVSAAATLNKENVTRFWLSLPIKRAVARQLHSPLVYCTNSMYKPTKRSHWFCAQPGNWLNR